MALTDICLSEGDSMIVQEELRGNIGTLTDQCITDAQVSIDIPSAGSSDSEIGFAYAS
jgi:hypothetical protein